eukprot:gene8763-711_t
MEEGFLIPMEEDICKHCEEEFENSFCEQCEETYCDNCFNLLHTPKARRNHEKLQLENFYKKNKKINQAFCMSCGIELNTINEVLSHKDHEIQKTGEAIIFYQKKIYSNIKNIEAMKKNNLLQIKKTENMIKTLKSQLSDAENNLNVYKSKDAAMSSITKKKIENTENVNLLYKWYQLFGKTSNNVSWDFIEGFLSVSGDIMTKVKNSYISDHNRFCVHSNPISQNTNTYVSFVLEKITGWAAFGVVDSKLHPLQKDKLWDGLSVDHGFYGISTNGLLWNSSVFSQNKKDSDIEELKTGDKIDLRINPSFSTMKISTKNKLVEIPIKFPCYIAIQIRQCGDSVSMKKL